MSLERTKEVDAVGVDKLSGNVTLTIVDSWDWVSEQSHLIALSEKINAYLGFVETGELVEAYPNARGRSVEILIISKYTPTEAANRLFEQTVSVAATYGVTLILKHTQQST